jgi:hypothetical protein
MYGSAYLLFYMVVILCMFYFIRTTVVHKWFWHKLNYFLFCQNFEILFIICAEIIIIIIIIIKLNSEVFNCWI